MKRALVTGAGGFIAHHLIERLKRDGYWVRGVDLKRPEFSASSADEFDILDLRIPESCLKALRGNPDEVYHLAAEMGGMGFIHTHDCEILRSSGMLNSNMADAVSKTCRPKFFFSSSVCVYRNMKPDEPEISENEAYPAMPDSEYGWEKLFAERMIQAYGRRFHFPVRIARFENCYGPQGAWVGGREKAPAAICRKIAEAENGGQIEIWGNGAAVRSFVYIEDAVDAVRKLMDSEIATPVNIGTEEKVTVNELAYKIARIANKELSIKSVDGPVGVESRNFSHSKMLSLGWQPRFTLDQGLRLTYQWVEEQMKRSSR